MFWDLIWEMSEDFYFVDSLGLVACLRMIQHWQEMFHTKQCVHHGEEAAFRKKYVAIDE